MANEETRDANVRLNADVAPYRTEVQGAAQDTDKLASSVDALASKLDGLGRRVSKKLTLFAAADLAMVGSMVAVTGQLQKQMDTLGASAAVTNRQIGPLTNSLRQMTRDLPVARGEITGLATSISKMGVTAQRDITGFTDTFLKASRATGESATGIASSMTQLSRQMGTLGGGNVQMKAFTDSLVKVSATAGVSAQSVADFANSIAPFARVAKIGQAQVLGLSSAFVQAGNDGFAAASTFNTMISDIVRQTSQGGPGLSKYASLVGTTVDQFKKLDGAQQIVKIFKAINDSGPQAVQVLDQMGFDGIRAAKAIQTMASQAGGLEKLINTAVGGYGGGATEKGAAAAMSGLNDELTRSANIAQDMATSIGQGMIGPFTAALNVVNNIGAQLSKMTGAFAAGGILAGVGGIAAGTAGGVGTLASLAAVPAAIGFIRRSSPVQAFQEGRNAGFARSTGQMIVPGPYSARQGIVGGFYASGAALGSMTPAGGGPGALSALGRIAGVPVRMGTSFMDFQRQFYADSMKDGNQRGNTNLLRSLGAAATSTERLAVSSGKAALAVARLEVTAAKAAVTNTAQLAGGALKAGGSALMGFLGGPVGLGIMGGLGALQVKGMADQRRDEIQNRDAGFYNQNAAYNAELGIATQNLNDLASTVVSTATKVETLGQAVQQAKADMGRGTTNPATSGIATTEQGVSYLRSLNTTDPEVLKKAFQDVRRALPFEEGNAAIDQFYSGSKDLTLADVGRVASGVDSAGSSGLASLFGITGSEDSDKRVQMGIGAAQQFRTNIQSKYGDKAGEQARILTMSQLLDQVFSSPDDRSPTAAANRSEAIAQLEKEYGFNFNYTAASMMQRKQEYRSGAEFLADQGAESDFGKYRRSAEGEGYVFGAGGMDRLTQLMVTEENPTVAGLRRRGFDITANGGLLGQAATTATGDADVQARAAVMLYEQALKNVKPTTAQAKRGVTAADLAGANLQGVLAEVPTSEQAYGALNLRAKEAQGLVDVDRQFQGVYQTRDQRLASSSARYQAAVNAPATADYTGNVIGAKQDLEAQKAQYAQFLMGLNQAQESFQTMSVRSAEDYQLQRRYSIQDFGTSMVRATEDFQKQIGRSQEDFQTSLKRQGEDTAKSIYNPFRRVYAEYTTDVGTLKQNLGDQTRRIKQQTANLRKLKRLGLTQQAIDMLDLANPANAQQAEELAQEMSKGDAATINRQVRSRQSATNGLTQSDLSQQYRRANQDFRKQMGRASADFETSIDRAEADFNKGLGRMAQARKTQMARAKEDLDKLGKEQAASFETLFAKAVESVKTNIGKASGITISELNRVRAAVPEWFGENPPQSTAKPRTVPGGARNADRSAGVSSGSTYYISTLAVASDNPTDFAKKMAQANARNKLKGVRTGSI